MGALEKHYLVVDWGTTNFRAFLLDENNKLVDSESLHKGLLQVTDGQFADVLETILKNWLPDYKHLPILMAGMVGSAKGWVNVNYVATPTDISNLAPQAHRFTLPWGASALIMPGVSHQYGEQKHDVMRGEEVQIFGLSKLKQTDNFTAILPGTHSKHVRFEANKIHSFSSFLTGEFYSILTKYSLLGMGLIHSDALNKEVFIQGVMEGQEGELTNKVFLGWTGRLFNQLTTENAADYLSGMLIGYELRNLTANQLYLVGGQELSSRYLTACQALSIHAEVVDGNQCFLEGMTAIRNGAEL